MPEQDQVVLAARVAEAVHDWFTTEEVAEHYRVAPSTVRYWKHAGIGIGARGVRHGRRVLYPRAAVEAHDRELAERSAAATA